MLGFIFSPVLLRDRSELLNAQPAISKIAKGNAKYVEVIPFVPEGFSRSEK